MDGSTFTTAVTLADVLEAGMHARVTFTVLRARVYGWAKAQGHMFAGADRLDGTIIVQYYARGVGNLVTETVSELPAYTAACTINTW